MAAPIPRTARDLLWDSIPNLNTGPHHTRSSALHPIIFLGQLSRWTNFPAEVSHAVNSLVWNNLIVSFHSGGLVGVAPDPIRRDYLEVGQESGVQGRFSERIAQVISLVACAEMQPFHFADAKCLPNTYRKEPDALIKQMSGERMVVVEVKTGWLPSHDLEAEVALAEYGNDRELRVLLGQIAIYMRDLNLKYGAVTTYTQTPFLRQVVTGRRWTLEYSPAIFNSDTGSSLPNTYPVSVSLRQCFWHVAMLSLSDRHFSTDGLRSQVWTKYTS